MKRGAKPKATRLKVLTGNPGKRQVPEEVAYPIGWPELPEWLDDLGRTCWMKCMGQLEHVGIVALIDGDLLAGYCDAVSCAIRASEKARTDASWNAERRSSWEVARHFGALFGIGPAERQRVSKAGPQQGNKLAQFLKGHA